MYLNFHETKAVMLYCNWELSFLMFMLNYYHFTKLCTYTYFFLFTYQYFLKFLMSAFRTYAILLICYLPNFHSVSSCRYMFRTYNNAFLHSLCCLKNYLKTRIYVVCVDPTSTLDDYFLYLYNINTYYIRL